LLLGLWPKPTPSSRERCEKVWGTFCFTLSLAVLHCQCSFTIICSFVLSLAVLYCHLQYCTVTCSATLSVQFYSVICSFALSLAVLHYHLQFYSFSCSFICSEVCDLFCVCDTLKLGDCVLNFKTNIKNLCV